MAKESAGAKAPANRVKINIPRQDKNDTQRLLSVNGKQILVQTGVDVWVEPMFAEVYYNSLDMEREQQAYLDQVVRGW